MAIYAVRNGKPTSFIHAGFEHKFTLHCQNIQVNNYFPPRLWILKGHLVPVWFSHLVVSDSFRLHGLQHARTPCSSLTPGACSNSCPSSRWCHPPILSSVVPFSSHLQSFPASGSFLVSQFFASDGQSTGVLASASVFPMNIQDWFPSDGLVGSPCRPRDSHESSPTPQFKSINSSALSFLYTPTLTSIHDYCKKP